MSQIVGDFLVQRLHDWGVSQVFGYPGDGINGVFGALNRADGKIQFIQARHEEMAAFMASANAKFSSRLGVCIATSAPCASHLIMGLYDALLDHQPVLAIVGQQARNALGGQYQQELDLVSIFQGCCQRLCGASLLSGPGPTFDRSRRPDRAIAPDRDRDHPTQRPVPPHITFQQAKNLSIALAKDDPDEAGVIRGVARQVLETVLPGKE